VKFLIGNSLTRIEGEFDQKFFRQLVSFYPRWELIQAKKRNRRPRPKVLLWRNAFPTGLLTRVQKYFPDVEVLDKRVRPEKEPFKWGPGFYELRDYQEEAVQRSIEVGRGTLSMGTASGKTFVEAELSRILGLRTLLVVPSTTIQFQTLKKFRSWLGKVGTIGGGKRQQLDANIIVACFASAQKLDLKSFGLLLFDESHHLPAKQMFDVSMAAENAYFRYGLSGTTKGRSDGLDMLQTAATGPVIYEYGLVDMKKNGHIPPAKVMFVQHRHTRRYKYNHLSELEEIGIVYNEPRNRKVLSIVEKSRKCGKKILVFVRRVAHGKLLSEQIPGSVFLYQNVKPDDRLRLARTKQVVFGTKVVEEGLDVDDFEVLVIAGGGSGPIPWKQKVGRGLRFKEGKILLIFDVYDQDEPTLHRWSRNRMKWCKQSGWEPKIIG